MKKEVEKVVRAHSDPEVDHNWAFTSIGDVLGPTTGEGAESYLGGVYVGDVYIIPASQEIRECCKTLQGNI